MGPFEAGEVDLDELVAVRSHLEPSAAQLLKGVLSSHGVPAYLASEHMGQLHPGVHTDLLVRAGDRLRAESLLDHVSALPLRRGAPANDPISFEQSCTQCGSSHIRAHVGPVPTVLPGVRIDAGPADGWFHCHTCGSYFRDKPARFQSLPTGLLWAVIMAGATFGLIWLINFLRWL